MIAQNDIKYFGATGRGVEKDTRAIQNAIDFGARKNIPVIISKGTYLVGSLFLRQGSKLHFEKGATLLGSTDLADFPEIYSRIAGIEMTWPAALHHILEVSDVEISGDGIIDGQGPHWWNLYWGHDQTGCLRHDYDAQGLRWLADYLIKRPRSCLIHKAQNIAISDITFQRGGFWNLQMTYSDRITVRNVKIRHNHGPSTDGIDIDSSTNVHITECDISCGDDCIVIKSGRDGDGLRVDKIAENIKIDHCKIRSGYGSH